MFIDIISNLGTVAASYLCAKHCAAICKFDLIAALVRSICYLHFTHQEGRRDREVKRIQIEDHLLVPGMFWA